MFHAEAEVLDPERAMAAMLPLAAGQGPFVVSSACSGHGAKFAPLLGEIIAGLAAHLLPNG